MSVNTGSESRAAPASSRPRSAASTPTSVASSNWRTIPKPNPRSSSPPRAVRTVIPNAQARLRSSSSSAVLPIPGGPSISRDAARSAERLRQSGIDRGEIVLAVKK